MTDHFGIGAAMKGMALTYFAAARGTGRTTSLIESAKDGDRIYFINSKEADRVKHLLREAGKTKVECVTLPVREAPHRLFDRGPTHGRAIFDHSWVEDYYFAALDRAAMEIDQLQNNLSGYGEPHRETRRKAMEIQKWAK